MRLSEFALAPVRCQRRDVRGIPVGRIYEKAARRAAHLLTSGSPSGLEALSVRVLLSFFPPCLFDSSAHPTFFLSHDIRCAYLQ